jgi:hypothetical protein
MDKENVKEDQKVQREQPERKAYVKPAVTKHTAASLVTGSSYTYYYTYYY